LWQDIYNAYLSFAIGYYNSTPTPYNFTAPIPFPQPIAEFIQNNTEWVAATAAKNSVGNTNESAYWTHVVLVMQQLQGIVDGYNSVAEIKLSYWNFVAWQLQDDLSDLYNKFTNVVETPKELLYSDHCSVLIKPVNNNEALFSSHVTWSSYISMLRTYKHFNLSFTNIPNVPQISYSSEPGFIPSGDDFFITSADLTVLETTNNIFNMSLYEYTTINTIPYWIRIMVANRMATTGAEWVEIFSKYNSGTYNNQWIVVDYKQFVSGESTIANGTLWIAEQIPGWVVSSDMSQHLNEYGYWASYNVPYFPFIYNISGYPEQIPSQGNAVSYTMCPRGQIFHRDQGKVSNWTDFVNLMRSNNWKTDPLSLGDPCNQVSSRCDLSTEYPGEAFGGIDCKATCNFQAPMMQSQAVSGPTTENEPPFSWTEEFAATPHFGQPTTFDFDFVVMSPSL